LAVVVAWFLFIEPNDNSPTGLSIEDLEGLQRILSIEKENNVGRKCAYR